MNLCYVSSIFDCASVSPVWREVLNCQTIRLKRPEISNFFQPEKSKGHEMIHISEKPFSCNICDKKFRRSEHLKRHEMTHTSKTRLKTEL